MAGVPRRRLCGYFKFTKEDIEFIKKIAESGASRESCLEVSLTSLIESIDWEKSIGDEAITKAMTKYEADPEKGFVISVYRK